MDTLTYSAMPGVVTMSFTFTLHLHIDGASSRSFERHFFYDFEVIMS